MVLQLGKLSGIRLRSLRLADERLAQDDTCIREVLDADLEELLTAFLFLSVS